MLGSGLFLQYAVAQLLHIYIYMLSTLAPWYQIAVASSVLLVTVERLKYSVSQAEGGGEVG